MRSLGIVLAVCTSALVFCPTGTVFAQEEAELPAPGITPDRPFYFFDELAEQIALRFTFGEEARAEKALQYAEEKLAEMNCMMAKNNARAAVRAMSGYTHYIDVAMEAVAASGNRSSSTQAMLALGTAKHTEIFDDITGKIPEEARQVMTQTRERALICQQMALGLLEQEDPKMANQVRLRLMERQRNSVRVIAEDEEVTNVQEDAQDDTTVPGDQNTDEDTPQVQGNNEEQAAGGEQWVGWGQPSDGEGPGLENHWGVDPGGQGAGWGEASDGEGPDLQNRWGQTNN